MVFGCCKSNSAIVQTPKDVEVDSKTVQRGIDSAKARVSNDNDSLGEFFAQEKSEGDDLKPKAFLESRISYEEDSVSTVYSEETKEITLATVKLPDDAYVLLPDVPQRGYEPWGNIEYSNAKMIREKPYDVGSIVWFRYDGHKFKWYIPGEIKSYVLDGNKVIGYEIHVDEEDKVMECSEEGITGILKKAPPLDTMLRWDEIQPPCPVGGIDDHVFNSTQSRAEKGKDKYGEDYGFVGAKQNKCGPEMWGITYDQLQHLTKDPAYRNTMTMYDVVNKIIKPKTAGTGTGYALHLNKDEPLQAKVMVSHAWGENFEQFMSALRGHRDKGPFWICAFSIYQNEDIPGLMIEKQLGPSPSTGPFATVLKQADVMLAIMTDSCDIYTRLWCVYEIFIAITLNVPVSLSAFQEITTSGGGSDAMYSNTVLDSSGKPVATSAAECGNANDKGMIRSEIEDTAGFDLIDDVVMWVRIKALIDDMPNAQERSWEETTMQRPIGSCSASNILARQDAGIANAIKVWKGARTEESHVRSMVPPEVSGVDGTKGVEESTVESTSMFGKFAFSNGQSVDNALDIVQSKFCCS